MTTTPQRSADSASALTAEDQGYHKGLKPRQLQMIAIGGAIGTGLFLGAGGRLHNAGPGLFLSYAFCGIFVFLILRALGELVLHRPSSGSFVSYAREFLGEKAAFVAGWMYWLNWALTGIAELSAVGLYVQHWWPGMPTWKSPVAPAFSTRAYESNGLIPSATSFSEPATCRISVYC